MGFDKSQLPFLLCSHGLGMRYFQEHYAQIYETDELFFFTGKKLLTLPSLKAYDRAFKSISPERLEKIKNRRSARAEQLQNVTAARLHVPFSEYLASLDLVAAQRRSLSCRHSGF